MSEIDTSNPAEALRAAVQADATPEQAPQIEQPVSTTEGDVGTTSVEEDSLFKNIDPSTLTPELKSLHDSLRSDYTQKTQALADSRKELESLGDMEQVRNAVEFVQALQDPANLVQLHGELSDYLQTQGLSKADADVAATETIQDTTPDYGADFEEKDPQAEAIQKELAEIRSFREEYQQERLQAEIEANLARSEGVIRQANPTYNDSDIESIYERSYAFGGDLMAAQKSYELERQRILQAYAQEKAVIPTSISSPSGTSGAERPDKFETLDDAHAYAKRFAAAVEGQGGFSE